MGKEERDRLWTLFWASTVALTTFVVGAWWVGWGPFERLPAQPIAPPARPVER